MVCACVLLSLCPPPICAIKPQAIYFWWCHSQMAFPPLSKYLPFSFPLSLPFLYEPQSLLLWNLHHGQNNQSVSSKKKKLSPWVQTWIPPSQKKNWNTSVNFHSFHCKVFLLLCYKGKKLNFVTLLTRWIWLLFLSHHWHIKSFI